MSIALYRSLYPMVLTGCLYVHGKKYWSKIHWYTGEGQNCFAFLFWGCFRGALVSKEEEERLNERAGIILREAGLIFEEWKDYNLITKKGVNYRYGIDGYAAYYLTGYADYYLVECWNETKLINEANVSVYRQLIYIDTKLGTSTSSQLSCCLNWTTRRDIIEVNPFFC